MPAPAAEAQTTKVTVVYGANSREIDVPIGANAEAVAAAANEQADIVIDMSLVTRVEFDGQVGNMLRRPAVTKTTQEVVFRTQTRQNG